MANDFTARVAGISVELGMSVQNKSGIWCKPTVKMDLKIDGGTNPQQREAIIKQAFDEVCDNIEKTIVVTPDDFEGRKPNVDEIKSLAIKHGADMIVIDQLSLMSDKRRADIPRIAYNNISEDLFLMSKELKKPVLLMAQANREAVKNRKKGESPELHDLAESDGVGQNATRVLSLSVIDGTLKISVKKNRYGINNKEVLMIWEVNTGYLKPLLSENPEESTEDKKDDKPDGEKDKGGEKDYGF